MNTTSHHLTARQKHCAGFTLLELLVVIGVCALAALMLVPALAGTRPIARAAQCRANIRQLTAAWTMYAHDNVDRFANNFGPSETSNEINTAGFRTWACDVLDWSSNSQNTNTTFLAKSLLGRYLGPNIEAYHCPADLYLSQSQRALGWTQRVRSYSINGFVGATSTTDNTGHNFFFPQYRQWLKLTQIANPSSAYVLIEEHPDSINEGLFINNPTSMTSWSDIPASHHHAECTLSFADGSVAMHKWLSATTRLPVGFFYSVPPLDSAGRADYTWLLTRMAVLY